MTVVASIHQPNYLPWLGYFHKMTYSDVFVFLDSVQYTNRSYINRCMISQGGNLTRLSIPVSVEKRDASIRDAQIKPSRFARKHLESLRHAYGKCPHYDNVMAAIKPSYEIEESNLADFNMNLTEALVRYLGLQIQFMKLSDLGLNTSKNQLMIDIAKACGADMYVSGTGARAYVEGCETQYEDAGLRLNYQNFIHPDYSQRHKPFVTGCSILDLLCNHGPDAREILSRQSELSYIEWNARGA